MAKYKYKLIVSVNSISYKIELSINKTIIEIYLDKDLEGIAALLDHGLDAALYTVVANDIRHRIKHGLYKQL